jgi:hypothetical protein
MNDVIAERVLELPEGEASKPVTVRVYRPERRESTWFCTATIALPEPVTLDAYGADSAQALFHALDAVGAEVRKHGLIAPAGHAWPVRFEPIEPVEKPKPPPLPPEVIAEREVERLEDEEGEAGKGKIVIYKPVPVSDEEWVCEYEIAVPGRAETRRGVHGVDSAQALHGALLVLSASLTHEPIITYDGYRAWERYRTQGSHHAPEPLFMKRLRAYGIKTPWLVDLDAGIQALEQLSHWLAVTKDTVEELGGVEALDRSLRYLQTAKGEVNFPDVQEWDISRISAIRKLLESGSVKVPPELERLTRDAIISWCRMASEIGRDA